MKYYTIRIETSTSGEETTAIRGFDKHSTALAKYYSIMGKGVDNETTASILVMLITSAGNVLKSERWDTPVETTTEEVSADAEN